MPAGQERSTDPLFDDLPNEPVIGQPSTWQIGDIPGTGDQHFGNRSQKNERDRSQDVEVAFAPVVAAGGAALTRYGPQAARIFEKMLRSVPPVLGAAEQVKKRSGQSENEKYPSPIPQPSKDDILKAKRANMDRVDPLPAIPGIEPPNEKLPDRTESLGEVIELPDLSGSVPETNEPTIFVYPAIEPNEFGDGIVERKGNEVTRKELECLRDYFELQNGWTHTDGGRYGPRHADVLSGEKKEGEELKEYRVPGHFKSLKGGRYSDLTFESKKGRIIHVQTVDIDKNGQTTQREWDAAEAIRRATGHSVLLIYKGAQLDRLIKRCKDLQFN